jgi:O-antigen ligase
MGTTANPQRLGAMLGMCLPFTLAVMVDRRSPPYARVAHAAIAAFAILMVIASGSRTGFLLVLIGGLVFFRTRLGPALLAVAGMAVFAVLGYLLVLGEALQESGGLVIRTNNSRTDVWAKLWAEFMASPLVGRATDSAPGESSYLSVLVMAGLVGAVPMAALVALLARSAVRVVVNRRALGPLAVYGDVAAASVAQMLAAWAFEAFALGTVTDHMLIVYCALALLGLLRDRLARAAVPAGAGDARPGLAYEAADDTEAGRDHLPNAI